MPLLLVAMPFVTSSFLLHACFGNAELFCASFHDPLTRLVWFVFQNLGSDFFQHQSTVQNTPSVHAPTPHPLGLPIHGVRHLLRPAAGKWRMNERARSLGGARSSRDSVQNSKQFNKSKVMGIDSSPIASRKCPQSLHGQSRRMACPNTLQHVERSKFLLRCMFLQNPTKGSKIWSKILCHTLPCRSPTHHVQLPIRSLPLQPGRIARGRPSPAAPPKRHGRSSSPHQWPY